MKRTFVDKKFDVAELYCKSAYLRQVFLRACLVPLSPMLVVAAKGGKQKSVLYNVTSSPFPLLGLSTPLFVLGRHGAYCV